MSFSNVKTQQQTAQPVILKEDEKIPLFLIKLWNIVEDPSYYDVIRWDQSGYSFHILDPYSFCRNVLPQYFKHNNLNSLIRQLNMYGFRKMTPIERTSLARAESDQDHLEFSHPCFVRDHPELLANIKRKAPVSRQQNNEGTVSVSAKDLSGVFEELRALRERQKDMESKMSELSKENEIVWQEMGSMRGAHVKQQQIVTKLVQFMVALLHNQPAKRVGSKRPMLAIDDQFQPKRSRVGEEPGFSVAQIQHHNVGEILDKLMRDYGVLSTRGQQLQPTSTRRNIIAPIISDVTDELDNANAPQPSTANYQSYNPYQQQQPSQQQFPFAQANNINLPINTNLPNQSVAQNANKRPVNVQQANQPQLSLNSIPTLSNVMRQATGSYPIHSDINETIPVISSPPDQNVSLAGTTGTENPIITSPANAAQLNFSAGDFANYLDGVDTSINQCRDMIGANWDDLDLDGLLSGYEDNSVTSPPNQQAARRV